MCFNLSKYFIMSVHRKYDGHTAEVMKEAFFLSFFFQYYKNYCKNTFRVDEKGTNSISWGENMLHSNLSIRKAFVTEP